MGVTSLLQFDVALVNFSTDTKWTPSFVLTPREV